MNRKPIYNNEGEIVGETISYENKKDCHDEHNHDMQYSQVAGVIGEECRDCDYHTN